MHHTVSTINKRFLVIRFAPAMFVSISCFNLARLFQLLWCWKKPTFLGSLRNPLQTMGNSMHVRSHPHAIPLIKCSDQGNRQIRSREWSNKFVFLVSVMLPSNMSLLQRRMQMCSCFAILVESGSQNKLTVEGSAMWVRVCSFVVWSSPVRFYRS